MTSILIDTVASVAEVAHAFSSDGLPHGRIVAVSPRPQHPIHSVKVVEVVRVSFVRGDGTAEEPYRRCCAYYSKGGVKLAESDGLRDDGCALEDVS